MEILRRAFFAQHEGIPRFVSELVVAEPAECFTKRASHEVVIGVPVRRKVISGICGTIEPKFDCRENGVSPQRHRSIAQDFWASAKELFCRKCNFLLLMAGPLAATMAQQVADARSLGHMG